MKTPITGIIPPLVTPLHGRDELDIAGLERLIEHTLSGGVSGIFILGTTGEGPSLSYRLRRELIERACKQTGNRASIFVGITDTAFVESVNLARHAADCGASALVVAPPYYMPEGQPELQEWLDHLAPELPLPLFLYNMPPLTKVSFELETVRRALDNPRILGLKDSSGDLNYFKNAAALLKQRPDWSLFIGPEEKLFEALQLGGHGGVSGGANLFPKIYVNLCDAFRAGELARAQELQKLIQRIGASLYRVGKHPSTIIKGIKCALACMGICDDFIAEPFHRFRSAERELLQSRLTEIQTELKNLNLA
ncbi:MAG TPA: dihydrodipicolinate synthase family protein [Verrucomicrobiae bacterium]|jgi:4-hydroxy-tetrahydrodipicolinate synthase|nr:dihydrodipicolinate synthase family protein [Verrucomicrobiae bacterium]